MFYSFIHGKYIFVMRQSLLDYVKTFFIYSIMIYITAKIKLDGTNRIYRLWKPESACEAKIPQIIGSEKVSWQQVSCNIIDAFRMFVHILCIPIPDVVR